MDSFSVLVNARMRYVERSIKPIIKEFHEVIGWIPPILEFQAPEVEVVPPASVKFKQQYPNLVLSKDEQDFLIDVIM